MSHYGRTFALHGRPAESNPNDLRAPDVTIRTEIDIAARGKFTRGNGARRDAKRQKAAAIFVRPRNKPQPGNPRSRLEPARKSRRSPRILRAFSVGFLSAVDRGTLFRSDLAGWEAPSPMIQRDGSPRHTLIVRGPIEDPLGPSCPRFRSTRHRRYSGGCLKRINNLASQRACPRK